jgi:hypothetical protein
VDAKQHKTSLAVWDLVSPLILGRPATMKVGVKCSAGCELSDHEVELHDETGQTIARTLLGAEAWPGTTGLYWTELEFVAPSTIGTHRWTVTCLHGDARLEITCITVPRPECTLIIRVCEARTKAALSNVDVRLAVYRASSDEEGFVKIEVPKGSYSLTLWKIGYQHISTDIVVTGTRTVDFELIEELEPAQPYWM